MILLLISKKNIQKPTLNTNTHTHTERERERYAQTDRQTDSITML